MIRAELYIVPYPPPPGGMISKLLGRFTKGGEWKGKEKRKRGREMRKRKEKGP